MTPHGQPPLVSSLDRSDRELEEQAERVARRTARTTMPEREWDHTGRVPDGVRRPVEVELGIDLSGARLRRDGSLAEGLGARGADAAAVGHEIHVAPGRFHPGHVEGLELVHHELVHLAQQRRSQGGPSAIAGDPAADTHAGTSPRAGHALPARPGSLQLGSCGDDAKKKVIDKLKRGVAITHDEAVKVMDEYKGMGAKDRDATIADLYSYGAATPPLQNLLQALTDEERHATYASIIKDMLQRVQVRATESAAGKSTAELAKVQGAHMEADAQAKALAAAQEEAKKKGLPPPKSVPKADVGKAHQENVKKESKFQAQVNEWDALGAAGQAAWWPKAKAARKAIVDLAKKEAPSMKLVEADITLDPELIAKESVKRGMSIFALSGRPMTVGISFIETAKADPKYVLGAVLHEIYGHPMHGSEKESYAWQLYDQSTAHFPSYSKPADRRPEMNLYAYPETEIYAEMIEASHSTPVSAADKAKGVTSSDDPAADIKEKVGRLARNLEPSVAKAVLLGMWERFRIDPRLSAKSLTLYKDAVNAQPGLKGTIP